MSLATLATALSPIVTRAGYILPGAGGENPSSLSLTLVALATLAVFAAYHRGPRREVVTKTDAQQKPPRRAA